MKINLPKSITICGIEYKICEASKVKDPTGRNKNELGIGGFINYVKNIIVISKRADNRDRVFWHEVVHGILFENGYLYHTNEELVDRLARGITEVLQSIEG